MSGSRYRGGFSHEVSSGRGPASRPAVPHPGPASNLVHPRRTAGRVTSTCEPGTERPARRPAHQHTHWEQLGADLLALLEQHRETDA
jgi:hypothetical protein